MKRHASPFRTLRRLRSPIALLLLLAVAGALLLSPAQAQTPSTDATLSALNLNLADSDATAVAISPAFASSTTAYTATVIADRVQVSPAPNDAGATWKARTGSDTFDGGLALLDVGDNAVTVEVMAADGATTKTYTVTVTRLEEIWQAVVTNGTNSFGTGYYGFGTTTYQKGSLSNNTFTYRGYQEGGVSMSVGAVSAITGTLTGKHIFATGALVNASKERKDGIVGDWVYIAGGQRYNFADAPFVSDSSNYDAYFTWPNRTTWTAGQEVSLAIGSKTAVIPVSPSDDAKLSALAVTDADDAAVDIGTFEATTYTGYTATVSTETITIAATPSQSWARKVMIKSGNVVHADGVVDLELGDNTVTVTVTAEDNAATQTYTMTVTRVAMVPEAVRLSGLSTDIGALSPAFYPDTTSYAIDLAAADSEIIVRPVTADAAATVSYVDGANAAIADADSAADGYQIPLAFGENTVKVRVAKGSPVQLTAIEYRTLAELAANAGRVLTYEHLLRQVWGMEPEGDVRPMRTVISSLRRKLGDDADNPAYIFTEPRVGYRLAGGEGQGSEDQQG